MAVNTKQGGPSAPSAPVDPGSKRVLIGANVALTIVLAGLFVAFLQFVGTLSGFVDMTTSSVNSVGEPTRKLLSGLETPVRLISLYAQTDLETPDQAKYRTAVNDLLSLFEACNRSKVSKEWINPLQDHDKRRALVKRLEEKSRFKDQIASVTKLIDDFHASVQPAVAKLIADEQAQIDAIAGLGELDPLLGNVRQALTGLEQELGDTTKAVDEYIAAEVPSYSGARSELRQTCDLVHRQLEAIAKSGPEYVRSGRAKLPPPAADFLTNARTRYQQVMTMVAAQRDALDKATKLDVEDVIASLSPTANGLLVETDDDAKVVRFDELWPPAREGAPGQSAGFHERAFKGEEKLASAILRVTHREQTAVVFVHFGGMPLFFGGFQGLPQAPYAKIKDLLEDANFVVSDWDLKTGKEPPAIDPKPTRIIYVVLKPEAPQQNQMQPPQDAPWGDEQNDALMAALGEHPRALFIAGWHPGPFGPLPSKYEFNDYLDKNWGLTVDTSQILLRFRSIAPGQYVPAESVFSMEEVDLGQHDIVSRLQSDPLSLPFCAPITRTTAPPGVTLTTLITAPRRDGLWGVHNIQKYEEQGQSGRGYFTKEEGDSEGPFDVAAAGSNGDAKVVLVSSRNFAEDRVAFNARMGLTAQGLTMFLVNPGNSGLLLNSLHWLNDNTAYMDLGKPIQMNTLKLPSETAAKTVRVAAFVFMPLLAIGAGLVIMFARRR